MAFTKLYLARATDHTAISGITLKGTWDAGTAGFQKALPTKRDDSSIIGSFFAETSATDGWRVASYAGLTGPLPAQTISGTLNAIIQVEESDAAANFHWYIHAVGDGRRYERRARHAAQ